MAWMTPSRRRWMRTGNIRSEEAGMATAKQQSAARRNSKKVAAATRWKRTIANLSARAHCTRRQGAEVARQRCAADCRTSG